MINSEETVKVLGVALDYELDFDPHASDMCRKGATRFNIFQRLKLYIGFKEKKFLFRTLSIQIKLYLFKWKRYTNML